MFEDLERPFGYTSPSKIKYKKMSRSTNWRPYQAVGRIVEEVGVVGLIIEPVYHVQHGSTSSTLFYLPIVVKLYAVDSGPKPEMAD